MVATAAGNPRVGGKSRSRLGQNGHAARVCACASCATHALCDARHSRARVRVRSYAKHASLCALPKMKVTKGATWLVVFVRWWCLCGGGVVFFFFFHESDFLIFLTIVLLFFSLFIFCFDLPQV